MAANTTLGAVLLSGLASARPAAAAVGTGTLYVSTDSGVIEQSDGAAWSTWATLGTAGAVTGPGSSTGDDFVQWDGAGGATLKDGGISLDTDGTLAANSDTRVPSQQAVKEYADQLLGAAHALEYKGATDCSANPDYPAAAIGDVYMVSVSGKIGGASGTSVNAGDLFVCITANAGGTQAAVGADWDVIHATATGSVTGPGSATSGDIVTFDGSTGAIIQDSGKAFDADGTLAADSDAKIATQKAVKTYVDTTVTGGGGPSGTFVLADSGGEETLNTVASSGATLTVDAADGNVHDITLDADCTFTLSAVTSGKGCSLTLILRQDGTGSRHVTWPGSVTWIGSGLAPTLQTAASSVDTVVLMTVDGGTTWYGVAQTSASGLAAGTSFPGSPSDGDLFYRSDQGTLYEYVNSVSRWLSVQRFTVGFYDPTEDTSARFLGYVPVFQDLYIESWVTTVYVATTSSGSAFYTLLLYKDTDSSATRTLITSFTTASDTHDQTKRHTVSVGQVIASATYAAVEMTMSKTGTPGTLNLGSLLVCRLAG